MSQHFKRSRLLVFIIGLCLVVAGCSSGHDTSNDNGGSGNGDAGQNNNDNSMDNGGNNGDKPAARFGAFDDTGVFQDAQIKTSNETLSTGQSTDVSV